MCVFFLVIYHKMCNINLNAGITKKVDYFPKKNKSAEQHNSVLLLFSEIRISSSRYTIFRTVVTMQFMCQEIVIQSVRSRQAPFASSPFASSPMLFYNFVFPFACYNFVIAEIQYPACYFYF